MNVQFMLLAIAFVVFLIGVIDWPSVSATRCISLGSALVVLAQLIGAK